MSARPDATRSNRKIDELKVPPQSIEAEQAVLGGLMLSPESINHLGDLLTDGDFYLQAHRVIYKAIIELSEKNQPYDAITIGEWLQANNLAAQIGGTEFLIDLVSQTPSAANIKAWAEIVREKSVLRQMRQETTVTYQATGQVAVYGWNDDGLVTQDHRPGRDRPDPQLRHRRAPDRSGRPSRRNRSVDLRHRRATRHGHRPQRRHHHLYAWDSLNRPTSTTTDGDTTTRLHRVEPYPVDGD